MVVMGKNKIEKPQIEPLLNWHIFYQAPVLGKYENRGNVSLLELIAFFVRVGVSGSAKRMGRQLYQSY